MTLNEPVFCFAPFTHRAHHELIKTAISVKVPAKSAVTFKALLHNQNFRKEQKCKGDSAHNI